MRDEKPRPARRHRASHETKDKRIVETTSNELLPELFVIPAITRTGNRSSIAIVAQTQLLPSLSADTKSDHVTIRALASPDLLARMRTAVSPFPRDRLQSTPSSPHLASGRERHGRTSHMADTAYEPAPLRRRIRHRARVPAPRLARTLSPAKRSQDRGFRGNLRYALEVGNDGY